MQIKQELAFKRIYKKMPNKQKLIIDDAIRTILKEPHCGEEKKQDLAGIFVYKFKIENQLYLLAYKFDPITLTLLLIGVHENFYKSLKIRRLKKSLASLEKGNIVQKSLSELETIAKT